MSAPDGARLFYERFGHGERFVIVPGRLFLRSFVRALGDSFTVVAYDTRDRGRSSTIDDPHRITIQADVDDVEAVRAHFGIAHLSLIGYSYMGMMVMLYALEHPDRVSRIVQLGPVPLRWDTEYPATLTDTTTPRPDSVALAALRALQRSSNADQRRLCEAQWAVDRYGLVGDPAHVDRLGPSRCDMPNEWPQHFRQHLDAQFPTVQALTHTWDEFRSVQSPVLTIHGTRDRNAPFGGGREWAARLPNARLIVVRDGAHQSFAEYPELVWPAVREFLLGQWPAAATTVR